MFLCVRHRDIKVCVQVSERERLSTCFLCVTVNGSESRCVSRVGMRGACRCTYSCALLYGIVLTGCSL